MQLLIVTGHPNPQSFSHALASAYEQGARDRGASVERIDVGALQFDPVLREQSLEPDLVRAQAAIARAEHIAWFFPTWWAGPPASVKGFVDRVFLPGFAYRYENSVLPQRLLAGRSARLVTSMDAPFWYYALFYRGALHRSFAHATLRFCGFGPVKTSTVYSMRKKTEPQRARLLAHAAGWGARDARERGQRLQLGAGTHSSNATPSSTR